MLDILDTGLPRTKPLSRMLWSGVGGLGGLGSAAVLVSVVVSVLQCVQCVQTPSQHVSTVEALVSHYIRLSLRDKHTCRVSTPIITNTSRDYFMIVLFSNKLLVTLLSSQVWAQLKYTSPPDPPENCHLNVKKLPKN